MSLNSLSSVSKILGREITGIWIDELAAISDPHDDSAIGKIAMDALGIIEERSKLHQSRCRLMSVLNQVAAQKEFLEKRPDWGTW